MNDSPYDSLWVEKYRPDSLDNLALDEEQKEALKSFVQAREIPHLLFSGPPGCGKTTTARILYRAIDCDVMTLNASKDRGIDVIRERVLVFARSMGMKKWKIVFLDEADGLTSDAQNSLKNTMEEFAMQTRFILTANTMAKVISPIQSRCQVFEFGSIPERERVLILKDILEKEGIPVDLSIVISYANKYTDLRRMVNAAQKSVVANKGILQPASAVAFSGPELLSLVQKKDWTGLIKCASDPGFDHRQALTNMFWGIQDSMKKATTLRVTLAKAVHETGFTPDSVVHFLGTCAEMFE